MPDIPTSRKKDIEKERKLASECNAHFANVAENIRKRNGIDNVQNNTESIKSSVKHQGFIFSPVTEDEVLKSIYSLKNTKSVGIDDINSFILKALGRILKFRNVWVKMNILTWHQHGCYTCVLYPCNIHAQCINIPVYYVSH